MADETLTWPSGAPADERRLLPVFSVLPNWKDGITERLEWLTDVMTSEQSVEQRRSIRAWPRRSFEAQFLRERAGRSRLDTFLAGVGRQLCLVPLWHDQYRPLAVSVSGEVQFETDTLQYREFRLNDLVLVTNKAHDRFGVLTVMSVDVPSDKITLAGFDREESWPVGSRIIPLRRARVADQAMLNNRTTQVATTSIRFALEDPDTNFFPSFGNCAPIWSFRPNRIADVSVSYSRDDVVLDYGGTIDVTDLTGRAKINSSFQIVVKEREQIAKFRAFLYAARGRAVRFYVPSYTADLHPLEDLGGDTIDCTPTGFLDHMPTPQEARRVISLVFHDGRPPVYRVIIGVEVILDGDDRPVAERFTLDQALPPVERAELSRIEFMVPSRFNQDSIEIFHPVDGGRVLQSSVAFVSSIIEDLPGLECYVTSRPYPAVAVDAFTTGFTFGTDGGTRPVPGETVSMTSAFEFGNGLLRNLLRGITFGPDSMTSGFAFGPTGTLTTTFFLKNLNTPVENMTSAFALNSGTLTQLLIQYTRWPVAEMTTSFNFLTGGTLE